MKSRKAARLHAGCLMGTLALLALVPGRAAHGADGADSAAST
ncbi:hypothetical protein [Nitrospirillum sp. BR 11828]|nr:hypothetical protein [Nitrospirillum sp. BR 11828]MDZ5650182.1 hypothetical protein [Nitrospirillum sp. BR 11828]